MRLVAPTLPRNTETARYRDGINNSAAILSSEETSCRREILFPFLQSPSGISERCIQVLRLQLRISGKDALSANTRGHESEQCNYRYPQTSNAGLASRDGRTR